MDDTASLKSTAALLPQQRGSSLDNSTAYNLMRIPIRAAILDDRDTTHPDVPNPLRESPKKPKQAFFKRGLSINRPDEDMRIVTMTREDYQQYWAKAPDGSLAPSVKEPEEGRKDWVRKQLALNEVWKAGLHANDAEMEARKSPGAMAKYAAQGVIGLTSVVAAGPLAVGAFWAADKAKRKRANSKQEGEGEVGS
ncbi:hypothetical protein LTR91_017807 [Friedmanniomyces endolithicus]|uniref:Uncharacterized protein n=2 Tax=Dothideomycetidae TaxID=451867 RepID=A0AAN6K5F4_9PEZI|nr:hypothetical protein LTR59_014753 [Friedmanniomyces endolithicus]KAK5141107.1 hypothetical protein LTR32_006252 [Rachicladosporium monterosium]KAK0778921.1 hypothetical protein LTR38_014624 [Friedmanniomyces endolithicus]KAK0781985.1 hypothetical protein LTR75_014522 [Friedmanniomyces endolithicus]KAK0844169.1 hypothetical protein LTR03_008192 [Friedmanniomyces endolithicus]